MLQITPFLRHWRITKDDPGQKYKVCSLTVTTAFPVKSFLIHKQRVGAEKLNRASYGAGETEIGVEGHQEGVLLNTRVGAHQY